MEKAKAKSRRVGVRLSSLINDFLEKWASEGEEESDLETRYETLKLKYFALIEKSKRLTRQLSELGALDEMRDLATSLGLDTKELTNLEAVVAKLMKTYNGPEENLHLFVSLLEVAKQRHDIGRQLTEIRRRVFIK